MKKLFCLFFLILCVSMSALQLQATDYVISVVDSVTPHNLMNAGSRILKCEKIFNVGPRASNVRIQRIASHSVDSGVRNNNARGMQIHERGIEVFNELTDTVIARVLKDWRESGHYTEAEINKVAETHAELSPHRLKLLTVESVGPGGFPQGRVILTPEGEKWTFSQPDGEFFSALRIYDSSPQPKSYGRKRQVPDISGRDTLELAEKVFPGFSLKDALAARGVERSLNTWSLGLGDVAGRQESGLRTLFSQVANLLDLHYNNRDYFNLNRTQSIRGEDVDVVFYANEKLVPYYQRSLEIDPLLGADGYPIYYAKNTSRYYIFHIKGSEFISKYFDLRFHQPLYGNSRGLKAEQDLRRFYLEGLVREFDKLDPNQFQVKNLDEFILQLGVILKDFLIHRQMKPNDETEFFKILARFVMLRRSLPDDIFEQTFHPETKQMVLEVIEKTMGPGQLSEKGLSGFAFLDIVFRDPIEFLINRSTSATSNQ